MMREEIKLGNSKRHNEVNDDKERTKTKEHKERKDCK